MGCERVGRISEGVRIKNSHGRRSRFTSGGDGEEEEERS